ncbi:glutamine amidotransferase [Salinibacter sp. 10B]|nr:glutamine amidotransferase [Salinibacter sp. 10B]
MNAPARSDVPSRLRSPLWSRSLQLLLIQARSAPRMVEQEQQCFVERCRVPLDRFRIVNVVRGTPPSPEHLSAVDAVLIGGAGKYSAAEDYEWTAPLLDFVRHVVDRQLPLFGSCWGHQVIARALGGTVVYDPDHAELGCLAVELTEAGANDPLFHRFPKHFRANMGHHDRVIELPPGATELARNDQPYQAFRLTDAPVYGTQFHSELDAERERERIRVYRKHYRDALPDEATVQRVMSNLADTTEVDHLLYDFLTTFVARGHPLSETSSLESPSSLPPAKRLPAASSPPEKRLPSAE